MTNTKLKNLEKLNRLRIDTIKNCILQMLNVKGTRVCNLCQMVYKLNCTCCPYIAPQHDRCYRNLFKVLS